MNRAVVIGQSHSVAIAQALAGECADVTGIGVYRLHDGREKAGADDISLDQALHLVAGLSCDVPLFLSALGTYHNILGMLRAGPDFDILLSNQDVSHAQARVIVPHRAIAGAFTHEFARAKLLLKIRAAARSEVYLLSAPPPKQSDEFMLQRLMRQKSGSYRGRSIRNVGVTRAESRLKLWALEASLARGWAQSKGMGFVPAPDLALNADGFLSRKMYLDDATHANARYGALVVRQICDILGSKQETVHG